MADEYIKREDAIAKPFRFYWRNGVLSNPVVSVRTIKELPAADVVPVVKAEWLPFGKRGIYGMIYACSSCRAKYDGITNYCPNCGAKMDGGAEDATD